MDMDELARDIIIEVVGEGMLIFGRNYPRRLPPELEPWLCYTKDGGHSLLVVVSSIANSDAFNDTGKPLPLTDYMTPTPVKTVERYGWVVRDGLLWSDVPYDDTHGVVVDHETEDEF